MASKSFAKGTTVATPYGDGVVQKWRPKNGIYEIKLSYGVLYTNPKVSPVQKILTPEQIKAAFGSFEKMRRLNLEVECNELGIKCDFEKCTQCLLAQEKPKNSFLKSMNPMPRKKLNVCILCSSPTCFDHLAKSFAKEKVTLCLKCEEIFRLTLDKDTDEKKLQIQLDRFTDAYDRGYVLLQYMCHLVGPLMEQLNAEETTDDHVALGTSSAGFVAGALGIIGTALILTPAGFPLLMTSLGLGTSGTTINFGYSAKKYIQAGPTEVANRIIAIHGILQHVLMSLVALGEDVRNDPKLGKVAVSKEEDRNQYLEALSNGAAATSATNYGLQFGQATGIGDTGGVFQALGLAPGVGTAFSAVMMASYLHTAASTIAKMHSGSKNQKAQMLADIKANLLILPTSDDVETVAKTTIKAIRETHDS